MVTYKYSAISKDGIPVSGVIEAYNEYEAVSRIKESCGLVTKIIPVREKKEFFTREIYTKGIDFKTLSVMCSQFAIILKSGISVVKCVELIGDQLEDRRLKGILRSVERDVADGHSLADSFSNADHSGTALPLTFIETVRAGERAGTMEEAFGALNRYYEKQYKMRQKISTALTYPIFVGIIAVIVLIVVMVKVIPALANAFDGMGGSLPFSTRLLVGVSVFFQKNFLVMGTVAAAVMLLFLIWNRTEKGRLKWCGIKLKMPVLGKIRLMSASSHFAHSMSTLLASGLPLPKALEITSNTIENDLLTKSVQEICGKLEEGRSLGECMREAGCFPLALNEMCAIGEETGELETALETIAEYFDNQFDYATQKAISRLEPALLVIMAVVSGFIVMSVYLPMFTMYDLM